MAIIEKDGFKFYDGLSSDIIVIEDNRINDYIEYINTKNISSVGINDLYYKNSDLSILRKCPHIKKVSIVSSLIEDYSGLYFLNDLRILYCNEPTSEIILTNLTKLEELSMGFNKNVTGLENCKSLKVLRLRKYNSVNKDLEKISRLTNIEDLALTQTNIISLKGAGNLPKLQKFELNYGKIEIIDELEKNRNTLIHLRFDTCNKIKNHEYVAKLKELQLLAFVNCGEIQSIGFIRDLPKLKSFIFVKTTIVDGDLSPCVGLDYVGFFDKKHYSHKSKDFDRN